MDEAKGTIKAGIRRFGAEGVEQANDVMAVEEPLELFLDSRPFYMTMRMPGDEIALALGYLFTEGIINSADDVLLVNYCGEEGGNRVDVTLDHERLRRQPAGKARRHTAYSSCGLCGKELIGDVCMRLSKRKQTFQMPASQIDALLRAVRQNQRVFDETGATHAAAVFSRELEPMAFAEDVGRHNAMDKVIGRLLLSQRLGEAAVVAVSSRISFEVAQKAARTPAEILIGVSSATSLAVELANEVGLTLVGFARAGRGNIYTLPERLV